MGFVAMQVGASIGSSTALFSDFLTYPSSKTTALDSQAEQKLDAVALVLKGKPNVGVTLRGVTTGGASKLMTIETRVAVATKYLESKGIKSTVTPEGQMETEFDGVEVFETGKAWVPPRWLIAKQQNMQVAMEKKDVQTQKAAAQKKAAETKIEDEKKTKEKASKDQAAKEKAAKKEKVDKELAKKKEKKDKEIAKKTKIKDEKIAKEKAAKEKVDKEKAAKKEKVDKELAKKKEKKGKEVVEKAKKAKAAEAGLNKFV